MMKFLVSEEETDLFVVNTGFSHLPTELPHAFCGAWQHSACIVHMGGRDRFFQYKNIKINATKPQINLSALYGFSGF